MFVPKKSKFRKQKKGIKSNSISGLNCVNQLTFDSIGFFASHALSDASEPWQLGLQDPATPIMESTFFFIII